MLFTVTNHTNNVYSTNWTGVTNGVHSIYARATDINSGTAYSQVEVFTVNTNLTFPAVNITSPGNGAVFDASASIKIDATATPSGQISSVEFYAGTNFFGSDTNAPFTVSRNGWRLGEYVLTAKAIHTNGTKATSIPITITVKRPEPTGNGYWDPVFGNNPDLRYPRFYSVAVGNDETVFGGVGASAPGSEAGMFQKWSSCLWSHVEEGGGVRAVALDGANLYLAGSFINQGPSNNLSYIARWDGANWYSVGNDLQFSGETIELLLAVAPIKGDVFIGGAFASAGGDTNIQNIARLTGGTGNWAKFGNGLDGPVRAIASIGDTLYVGGEFTNAAGNTNIQYLARWTGNTWTNVGGGVNGIVRALAVQGSDLFVGGEFTTAGGLTNVNRIA